MIFKQNDILFKRSIIYLVFGFNKSDQSPVKNALDGWIQINQNDKTDKINVVDWNMDEIRWYNQTIKYSL
jgi:hypothetical protein